MLENFAKISLCFVECVEGSKKISPVDMLGTELLYEKNPGQAMHSFLLYFFFISV